MSVKLLYLLWACSVSASLLPAASREPCPLHEPTGARLVDNKYLVKLREGYTLEDHFAHVGENLSLQPDFSYLERIHYYHAALDDDILHSHIRLDPGVEFVERDHYIDTPESHVSPEPENSQFLAEPHVDHKMQRRGLSYVRTETVSDDWWHSQITIGKRMDPVTSRGNSYNFKGAGLGVDIYVLDSGILLSHDAFSGRATNFQGKSNSKYTGGPADDNDSHGTHVASIAAKVAPNANIINVKIACKRVSDPKNAEPNCKAGTAGGLAQAITDVTSEHNNKKKSKPSGWKGSVINLSTGQVSSQPLGDAIFDAYKNGVPIAAAAGNGNTSRVDEIPYTCYNKKTMCVGATDKNYRKSIVSNYGKSVGINAPGEYINGAWNKNDTAYQPKMGTSQATPQVAGAMAIFIGYEGINDNTQQVYDTLASNWIPGLATGFDVPTTSNFLNTGINNPSRGFLFPYNTPDKELKVRGAAAVSSASTLSTANVSNGAPQPTANVSQGAPQPTTAPSANDDPLAPGYIAVTTLAATASTDGPVVVVSYTPLVQEGPEVTGAADDFWLIPLDGTATATATN